MTEQTISENNTISTLPVYSVLLAGGSGTRLWPVSRKLYPKQLVSFIGEDSLVQSTIKRVLPVVSKDRVKIVCGGEHAYEIARHMKEINVEPKDKIITEPCGRNTGPAVLLAVYHVLDIEEDAVMFIFPADHVIKDAENFTEKLKQAVKLAEDGYIVTFGIQPEYPETGYGYIEGEGDAGKNALSVKRFVEKPDLDTAVKYLKAGNFFWNSGMFAFKASVIMDEFKRLAPDIVSTMDDHVWKPGAFMQKDTDAPYNDYNNGISEEDYKRLPDISIDYAIMEKTDKAAVLPSSFGWSDIGSWKSLYDFLPKNEDGNVLDGDIITRDTKNAFIMGHGRLITTNKVNNIVVVDTPDSLFVSDLEESREVKSIVGKLKERGRKEYNYHVTTYHPWGSETVMDETESFKTSRILIYPDQSLEFDCCRYAFSNLLVVAGKAKIAYKGGSPSGSSSVRMLKAADSLALNKDTGVLMENLETTPLVVIEVKIFT